MRPNVEVCLVSFESGDDLLAAITSIAKHTAATVAIQENATTSTSLDAAVRHATELGLTVRAVHDPTNPGFGRACNALAASSTADLLLFLNPDARITKWPFDDKPPPSQTICGPAEIDAPNPASHRGVSYSIADEMRRSWLRRWGSTPDGDGFVSGAALLVARCDFAALGGFDPRFFLFYEDIELCLRANRHGVKTTLVDGFSVEHRGGHATNERFKESLVWSYESASRFHGLEGHSVGAYRAYVIVDAAARWSLHLMRRERNRRRGYAALISRVSSDLAKRRAT